MEKKKLWKPLLLGLLLLFALLYVLPSIVPGGLPDWYPFTRKLNYGLDLKGGLSLRYTVDYKKAISDNTLKVMEGVRDGVVDAFARGDEKDPLTLTPEERAAYEAKFQIERTDFDTLTVTFAPGEDADVLSDDAVELIDPYYVRLPGGGNTVELKVSDVRIEEIKQQVVEQTVDNIRKRVEAFGLTEPDVRRVGDTDVDIQIPGVSKSEMDMVRERIGQTAQLTFRMTDDETDFFRDQTAALEAYKAANPDRASTIEIKCPAGDRCAVQAEKKSELVGFLKTLEIPDERFVGFELVQEREGSAVTRSYYRTMYLKAKVELSGETLSRAMVLFEQQGEPYVSVEFNAAGARRFAEVTAENVGKRMAIMLDDEVNSAPVIKEEIAGGRAKITLGGGQSPQETLTEARGLVTVLNQGAYQAPVHKVHDDEVGPTLGRDAIRGGVTALIVGSVLVFLFIIIYYRMSGVVAAIGLSVNILLLLAILVSFDAALTLPGLAGIVLTVGMAVDANVLVNERIREELRAGKTFRVAVDLGYQRAFWAIFDSNITTALAGAILLNFSSGPVYGFAVTLLIGIATTLFSAVVVTRMVFRFLLDRRKGQALSI